MVKCWGFGWEGSLGNGDQRNIGDDRFEMGKKVLITLIMVIMDVVGHHLSYTFVGSRSMVIDIALGGFTSMAILSGILFIYQIVLNGIEGGFLKCWGYNYDGQCGYGHSGLLCCI